MEKHWYIICVYLYINILLIYNLYNRNELCPTKHVLLLQSITVDMDHGSAMFSNRLSTRHRLSALFLMFPHPNAPCIEYTNIYPKYHRVFVGKYTIHGVYGKNHHYIYIFIILIGGLEHFSIYWEWRHPNWRSHIFSEGLKPPTSKYAIHGAYAVCWWHESSSEDLLDC